MRTRKPTELPASLKNIDVKAVLRKRGVYFEQKQYNNYLEVAKPLAKAMLTKKKKVSKPKYNPQLSQDTIKEYVEKQVRLVETVETHFQNKITQYIKHVERGFLDNLTHEINEKTVVKGYFDDNEDELLTRASVDFTPLLESIATLSGQNALKLINSDDVYIPFKYREQIRENVNKFAKSLLDTDKQILTDILNEGISKGESMADIRKHIEDVFPEYTKNQANRITVTEVSRASVQAANDAWEQSGVVEGKQWVIFGAVDECADYDGQVVTLSGSFYSNDSEFADGDPPLHPNCKCQLIPILVDEQPTYQPNKEALLDRVKELESQVDKRTKEFKQLQSDRADDQEYIKQLEVLIDEKRSEIEAQEV